MVDTRRVVGRAVAVLVIVGAGTFLGIRSTQPPKPSLPYPSGQELASVRGNCKSGNELLGCDSLTGPRTFLTVAATGDVRAASDALFEAMGDDGWKQDDKGLVAADYAAEGASEDIQPVFCKDGDGCVGLFRYAETGYVLAWWSRPAG